MEDGRQTLIIGVVGVCGAGKSTLVRALRACGIEVRHIAQEHSYVPYMWQKITHPDLLIYLGASYSETVRRRRLDWTVAEYEEQLRRLEHARAHAHLRIETDALTEREMIRQVLAFLAGHGVHPIENHSD